MVSYNKLWHLLIDKKMRKSDLLNATGISLVTLAKMTHDEDMTTSTLSKIRKALGCDIGDIMEIKIAIGVS